MMAVAGEAGCSSALCVTAEGAMRLAELRRYAHGAWLKCQQKPAASH
jgi:hypothetical protein